MESKIKEVMLLMNGLTCSEAIFILNTVIGEIEIVKKEKIKKLKFKI